jgi:hypothetical protein
MAGATVHPDANLSRENSNNVKFLQSNSRPSAFSAAFAIDILSLGYT